MQANSIQVLDLCRWYDIGRARLSMTPLPCCVSQKGMPTASTKWRSMLDVILRFAPAPITSSGCRAVCAQIATGFIQQVRSAPMQRKLSAPRGAQPPMLG